MNIFKRILKIGQAEIHAFVERMENPVSMMEQGIKDLKQELIESVEAYAKVRALVIRTENTISEKKGEAKLYEEKAIAVLQKAQNNALDPVKAESLAMEALRIKQQLLQEVGVLERQCRVHVSSSEEIQESVEVLRFNVSKWEKELATLRAKEKVAKTSEIVNRHIADMEENSTIELLERMKSKIADSESRSEVYGDLSSSKVKLDKSLHDVLSGGAVKSELDELKKQMGLD